MKTERIQRKTKATSRAANSLIIITAEDGKKLINQDYLDYKNGTYEGDNMPELSICAKIYLSDSDSALNYAEIDESTAEEYQKEYDKIQEDKINNMNNNIDI
nr:MAG TPA: hypothetical protein [Crassvirales sp.]